MERKQTYMLDIPIDCRSLDELIDEAKDAVVKHDRFITFACANPHSIVTAQHDEAFKSALYDAEQVVADGVGVLVMAKFANLQIGPRITGCDYFLAIMNVMEQLGGKRVFFFGSSEHVLSLISSQMALQFPKLVLCGMLSPPFGTWTTEVNEQMIESINSAKPDIVWVGMTAPKQEKWVFENRKRLCVPLIGSIGAVFDFFAGTYPRAPDWACRFGIEWLYRLFKEPRRMWRRNLLSSPIFVIRVIWRHVFRQGKS